ncbi:type II toxin-antitoxin system PemK/MazF family toxin [Candidatus Saccharibacteria bacterium]|nr:type II toxin-antitoxin system PemK/MazF family toxin [Candidatus Saccharibacteria bacterium]
METNEKKFNEWIAVKENVHFANRLPSIREGEVWWCAIGENVGIEINGKSDAFSRPVLIMKKFSRFGFLGIPLTSKKHVGDRYVPFAFKGRIQCASLAQIRVLSVSRLYKKMGMVPHSDLDTVKEGFRNLYL